MGWTVYEVSRMRIKQRLAKDLSQSDKESEWEKGRESMFWKGSRSKVGKGKEKSEKCGRKHGEGKELKKSGKKKNQTKQWCNTNKWKYKGLGVGTMQPKDWRG